MKKHKYLDVDQLIQILVEKSEGEHGYIAKLSKKTGIPYDRLMGWKYKRGHPKGDDMTKLQREFEELQNLPSIAQEPETEAHPDHTKYVALLEKNNKTLEESIQLSLNSILEGQSDLRTFARENDNRTLALLRDVAVIRDLLGTQRPPSATEEKHIDQTDKKKTGHSKGR